MDDDRLLPARFLQLIGVVLLVAAFLFWTATGRESVLMVSSAMTLIGIGAYRGAIDEFRTRRRDRGSDT